MLFWLTPDFAVRAMAEAVSRQRLSQNKNWFCDENSLWNMFSTKLCLKMCGYGKLCSRANDWAVTNFTYVIPFASFIDINEDFPRACVFLLPLPPGLLSTPPYACVEGLFITSISISVPEPFPLPPSPPPPKFWCQTQYSNAALGQ
jgi:hypothetical protein